MECDQDSENEMYVVEEWKGKREREIEREREKSTREKTNNDDLHNQWQNVLFKFLKHYLYRPKTI